MAKGNNNLIGSWAFLIGVILALIIGLFGSNISGTSSQAMLIALIIIGLIVGFLNITSTESAPFLMSGAVLIIASALGQGVMQPVPVVNSILDALLALFVPATILVAVKNVFVLARR